MIMNNGYEFMMMNDTFPSLYFVFAKADGFIKHVWRCIYLACGTTTRCYRCMIFRF